MGRNVAKGAENRIQIKKGVGRSKWVADTYTKTHPLIGALRRHLVEKVRQEDLARPHNKLHPSDMAKKYWCPRQSWFRMLGTKPDKEEDVGYWLANILSEGTEIHGKYQRWFAQMGILEGVWQCNVCEAEWWGQSPEQCVNCGSEHIWYAEVPIWIPDLFADGHADGIVNLEGKRRGIEIKSIGLRSVELEQPALYRRYKSGELGLMEMWRSIKMPFGSHLKQGQIYLHGFQQDAMLNDVDEMIFIYEFKANQDVRAWTVKYNADVIGPLLPGAQAVETAIETGKRVKHPVWASPDHSVCKACPFLLTCDP